MCLRRDPQRPTVTVSVAGRPPIPSHHVCDSRPRIVGPLRVRVVSPVAGRPEAVAASRRRFAMIVRPERRLLRRVLMNGGIASARSPSSSPSRLPPDRGPAIRRNPYRSARAPATSSRRSRSTTGRRARSWCGSTSPRFAASTPSACSGTVAGLGRRVASGSTLGARGDYPTIVPDGNGGAVVLFVVDAGMSMPSGSTPPKPAWRDRRPGVQRRQPSVRVSADRRRKRWIHRGLG